MYCFITVYIKKQRMFYTFKICFINICLCDKPELINEDAFENWIMKVELSDKSELDNLMDAAAYEEICKE